MRKLPLVSILVTLLFVANVHGQEQTSRDSRSTSDAETTLDTAEKKIKFGIHYRFAIGIDFYLPGNHKSFGNAGITVAADKIGAFGEYKIHEVFSLQTAFYWLNLHTATDIKREWRGGNIIKIRVERYYASIPVILRYYPGKARQFCIFSGIQTNYLIQKTVNTATGTTVEVANGTTEFLKNSNWGFQLILGTDYEFIFGLQLGIEGTIKLTDPLRFDDVLLDHANYWGISLGYNFGKFL